MYNKAFIFLFFFHFAPNIIMSQTTIPLYKNAIPNSIPSINDEHTEILNGITRITKVSVPTLSIFLPAKEKSNGTAVIICPGGSYVMVAAGHEGTDVAKKFNEIGVAAFVLKYRIPNAATMIDPSIGPLQDAQEAIKMVREGAKEFNIDPDKIGIMGFSAGGHLAATAGTHFNKSVIQNSNNTSLRPNFMMLIYPVISFADSIGHQNSREQLIGKHPTAQQVIEYSNELQVTGNTPPTFLVHASDDDGVKVENSLVFYSALIHNKVPAEMHIYQNGGHGFGMKLINAKELWMDRCKNWMENNGLLKQH